MSLIRWSPFIEQFENMGLLEKTSGLIPAIDVYDRQDAVVIETALPGVDSKNVDISIENGVLCISGSTERKTEVDEKDYYRKEIRSGSFMRKVGLPESIDEAKTSASCTDGILKIEIKKKESTQPKKISIKIENI